MTDDERDFYGSSYWFTHAEERLGLPNILVRSKKDLPERCLYWLRTAGTFRFQKRQLFLSETLPQEDIGLEETGDGICRFTLMTFSWPGSMNEISSSTPETVSPMFPVATLGVAAGPRGVPGGTRSGEGGLKRRVDEERAVIAMERPSQR